MGGSCGDGVGFNMIAGTHSRVRILRRSARGRHAAGNHRALRPRANQAAADLPDRRPISARFSSDYSSRTGTTRTSRSIADLLEPELSLFHGDLVELGKGEVWMRTDRQRTGNTAKWRPSTLKYAGGTVYDPANGIDGQVRDVWIAGGKIVAPPDDPEVRPTRVIDARGLVVMPGGVDMHCHIVGSKVNTARKMCPEQKRRDPASVAPTAPAAARWEACRARLPPATDMPDSVTRPRSTRPFHRWRPAMPTKSLRTPRASTKASTR